MDSDSVDEDYISRNSDDEQESHLNDYILRQDNERRTQSMASSLFHRYLNIPHHEQPLLQQQQLQQHGDSRSAKFSTGIHGKQQNHLQHSTKDVSCVPPLLELSAQAIACHLPFGHVERFHQPVPEPLQLRIAFWSFPQDENDIRLYACLANGGENVSLLAEHLIDINGIRDVLQVGFHLSATVYTFDEFNYFKVSITFDRRKITSCMCSCSKSTLWCEHVVALCLYRIRRPNEMNLRVPVSESLQRLDREKLQKFAQYLINELHNDKQQILPSAQKLLDQLLSSNNYASINNEPAAPDPTAGATATEQTFWCLDDSHLSSDIKKFLTRQCRLRRLNVCADINSLNTQSPQAAIEYEEFLIRNRDPGGLWSLIDIVGKMMRKRDSNSLSLLNLLTYKMLAQERMVTWWFETKVSMHLGNTFNTRPRVVREKSRSTAHLSAQHSTSVFCDEIVRLWRLTVLNPNLSQAERKNLAHMLSEWHVSILRDVRSNSDPNSDCAKYMYYFSGFKLALEAASINWDDWDPKTKRIVEETVKKEVAEPKTTKKKRKGKNKGQKENDIGNNDENKGENAKCSSIEEPTSSTSEKFDKRKSKKNNKQSSANINMLNRQNNASSSSILQSDANNRQESFFLPRQRIDNSRSEIQASLSHQHPQPIVLQEIPRLIDQNAYANGNNREDDDDDGNFDHRAAERLLAEVRLEPHHRQHQEDLQVYFMPPNANLLPQPRAQTPQSTSPALTNSQTFQDLIRINPKRLTNPLETLYSKTEGLYAHGYEREAKKLAVRVAREMLADPNFPAFKPSNLVIRKRKKRANNENQSCISTAEGLQQMEFICRILINEHCYHHLTFVLALSGLEMKRLPATTKPLEVKLITVKQVFVSLLKSMPLYEKEVSLLREKAEALYDGFYENHDALTVLLLGTYLFEVLVLFRVLPSNQSNVQSQATPQHNNGGLNGQQDSNQQLVYKKSPEDENLGFRTALSALSFKANLLETLHPLLCEGVRRQRGELLLMLLDNYKNEKSKLDEILDCLIEKDVILPGSPPTQQQAVLKTTTQNHVNNAVANEQVQVNPDSCPLSPDQKQIQSAKAQNKKASITKAGSQPTEASAYFIYELAGKLYDMAGGSSSTAHLFRLQNVPHGVHHNLHMCVLRLALYALNLHNRGSLNWHNRTYSGWAFYVQDRVVEIGLPAFRYLCTSWENCLTAKEVALIANKAASSTNPETKLIGAKLAKSCLKHVKYLDDIVVQSILNQCMDVGVVMLAEACQDIEQVSQTEEVDAEIMFAVARAWTKLFESAVQITSSEGELYCDQQQGHHISWDAPPPSPIVICYDSLAKWLSTNPRLECESTHITGRFPWSSDQADNRFSICKECVYSNYDYVNTAFRYGIKALDCCRSKSGKHKPLKDHVHWLKGVGKFLGSNHMHELFRHEVARRFL